jgi:hypothetical protein
MEVFPKYINSLGITLLDVDSYSRYQNYMVRMPKALVNLLN